MVNERTRLIAAALVVSTAMLAGTSLLVISPAAAKAPKVQVGLFGTQDPTYDGAFRQSLALLAYVAADATPPVDAITWLLDQQCADGGFQAYRADPSRACTPSNPATYSGEDTNSTGMAAAALHALGRTAEANKALGWLTAAQNTDGGFPYFVAGDSDANSTAVALFATNTDGRAPASVQRGGVSAADFLTSLQVGCDGAATDDDGGFAFQDYGSGLVDNDAASVQATLALSGAALPLAPHTVSNTVPRATCPATDPVSGTTAPEVLGAGHLARLLDAFDGAVPQFDYTSGARVPGSVSVGDTAWAALSLASVGVGSQQLDAALATLAKATGASAGFTRVRAASAATDQPGLLGVLALAVGASGGSSTALDALTTRIGATMRTAPVTASPSPSASSSTSASESGSATASASSSANGSDLPPTGATSLTPVLGGAGGLLVLLGLLALLADRRRGTHA